MILKLVCRALAASTFLILAAAASNAQDEPPPSADPAAVGLAVAGALVQSGRFEEALSVLRPLAQDDPESTDILFLIGLAAIEASQRPGTAEADRVALLDEAISALNTILIDRPGLVRVRLELARAFFLKGEDSLARRSFELVLAGEDLPPGVAANIGRFLSEIRARRRWSMHFGMAMAPDSNLGATSEERIIYIFGLPFERDAESLKKSGVGVSVWGGGEYQHPLGERLRLRAGFDISRQEYEGRDFDRMSLSGHFGPRWLANETTDVSLLASARQAWVRTAPDHRDVGARIEMGRRLTPRVAVNGRASWHRREYRTRVTLDGRVLDVSLGGSWVITPTVRAEATAGYGRERPEAEKWRQASRRAGVSVSVALPAGFTVGGGGELRWTSYEGNWFPFTPGDEHRADRTRILRTSVQNRSFTAYGFSPELVLVSEVRRSNAQLHDYRKTRAELRFVRQF